MAPFPLAPFPLDNLAPLQRFLVTLTRYAVDYCYPGCSTSTQEMHTAYRAGWAVADHPAEAIAFLLEQLKPAPAAAVNSPQVERWLADLDSDEFAMREAVAKGLAPLGAAIEPRLRKALEETFSAVVRRRVQAQLDDL